MKTRFTERFQLKYPIACAPMALVAGGALAGAVSRAGGLGLLGGGYGDMAWMAQQQSLVGGATIGGGLITWSLDQTPELLDAALAYKPIAFMLSFGDPRPYAAKIKASGAALICQIQRLSQLDEALEAGADVIVAQSSEAGGHGMTNRATITLVPEVADILARRAPDTLLLAAGGIGDGRGLAAVLALGADGALVGSRLWASQEALVNENSQARAIELTGDDTDRSNVFDILRDITWPPGYTFRALTNTMTERWSGNEDELLLVADEEREKYNAAMAANDYTIGHSPCGQVAGLIRDIPRAADILEAMDTQATEILLRLGKRLQLPRVRELSPLDLPGVAGPQRGLRGEGGSSDG
ncbi:MULTISPECIES: NAD(P)H-dependent flavin oxidoreductase [Myxococcus]|uniref:NAD(P)H-dependent flavin oxidoreductase n=1 Tax=Myxococcus TaxID=32 RepID=UPI0013D58F82|nr:MULTISPECIES: nitronate monooxygenase [Myxococcus]NVJ25486.1 nitronate monooxygenase [Myxococcus sp. AM011]